MGAARSRASRRGRRPRRPAKPSANGHPLGNHPQTSAHANLRAGHARPLPCNVTTSSIPPKKEAPTHEPHTSAHPDRCPPAHRLCVRRTGTTHHRHDLTPRRPPHHSPPPKPPPRHLPQNSPSAIFSPSPRTKTAAPSGTPATRSMSFGTPAI